MSTCQLRTPDSCAAFSFGADAKRSRPKPAVSHQQEDEDGEGHEKEDAAFGPPRRAPGAQPFQDRGYCQSLWRSRSAGRPADSPRRSGRCPAFMISGCTRADPRAEAVDHAQRPRPRPSPPASRGPDRRAGSADRRQRRPKTVGDVSRPTGRSLRSSMVSTFTGSEHGQRDGELVVFPAQNAR